MLRGHMQKHMDAEVHKGKVTHICTSSQMHFHIHITDGNSKNFVLACQHKYMHTLCIKGTQAHMYKGTHKGIA